MGRTGVIGEQYILSTCDVHESCNLLIVENGRAGGWIGQIELVLIPLHLMKILQESNFQMGRVSHIKEAGKQQELIFTFLSRITTSCPTVHILRGRE